MGLFDKAFNLPGVQTAFSTAIGGAASQAVSFAVAGASQKISEAASGMLGTFGGVGSFTKLGANFPSIDEMSAAEIMARSSNASNEAFLNNLYGVETTTSEESTPSASQVKAASGVQTVTIAHKVSLKEKGSSAIVYFEVLPEIVEQHQAEYEAIAPSQFPGAFQKYKGTTTTQWTLNCTFISRTSAEATQNYHNLLRLKGWTRPFYGTRTGVSYPGKLGAPPPVLTLSGLRDLIGPVPVVITQLNWNWPKDVDYIPTKITSKTDGNLIPFPAVLNVPIQLVESYSVEQFNQFSLEKYRAGQLDVAFSSVDEQVASAMNDSPDLFAGGDELNFGGDLA